MDGIRAKDMAHEMADIPLLTHELLDGFRKAAAAPGRVAWSWMTVTRLVQQRLRSAQRGRGLVGRSFHGSATHYLSVEMISGRGVAIEFGVRNSTGGCLRLVDSMHAGMKSG